MSLRRDFEQFRKLTTNIKQTYPKRQSYKALKGKNRRNIISLGPDDRFVDATPKTSSAVEKKQGWVGNDLKKTFALQKPHRETKREVNKWQ